MYAKWLDVRDEPVAFVAQGLVVTICRVFQRIPLQCQL